MGNPTPDFSDLRGLTKAVRTFAAAVQRGERILLIAGPGSGAVAIASRAVGLLPEVVVPSSEARAIDAIREAGGLGDQETRRPFRAPHHTVSWTGMFGFKGKAHSFDGTTRERNIPGELELARHGVLLLDEATEFSRRTIEGVGSAIDDSTLLIARVLPCPCGMGSHPHKSRCTCTEAQRDRWVGRLGRLTADLDIACIIEVPFLSNETRAHGERCPSTSDLLTAGGE